LRTTSLTASAPLLLLAIGYGLDPARFGPLQATVLREGPDLASGLLVALALGVTGARLTRPPPRSATSRRSLGPYELQELLGEGGMGEIWRARHRFLGRPAAVKIIHPRSIQPLGADAAAQVLRRFEREARATAMLESPHTVQIYDFGHTEQGDFYYAMELLRGFDLEAMVDRHGPLHPGRTVHFLLQACDSLAEAHDRGQIHRDIKPSNLFACCLGRSADVLKVLDFGLVTRAGSEPSPDLRLLEHNEVAGTPAYMAPEQVLAVTEIDARADVYALGCVAYWLLTGHTVFDVRLPLAMAVAHVKAPPLPPSRRTETHVPVDLEQIVLRCLRKDPDRRPADADELADRLRRCECHGSWGPTQARQWWLDHGQSAATVSASGTAPGIAPA